MKAGAICRSAVLLGFVAVSCKPPAPVHSTNGLTALRTFGDSVTRPPRPPLHEGLDTNDAVVYYQAAVPLVRSGMDLRAAEAALYWASRLDPWWADPVYARSLLLLRAARNDAFATFYRTRSARAARSVALTERQVQLMDSLRRVAWARNPFVFTGLDFADFIPGRHGSPEEAGLYAFKSQQFAAADSFLAIALRKHPGEVGLRIYRAPRQLDEAELQLRDAVALDSDYAAPYHRLGAVYQAEGKIPQATEQYRAFLARAAKRDPDRATVTHALVTLGVLPAPPDSR